MSENQSFCSCSLSVLLTPPLFCFLFNEQSKQLEWSLETSCWQSRPGFWYFPLRQPEDNSNKQLCLLASSTQQHKHPVCPLPLSDTSSAPDQSQANNCSLPSMHWTSCCYFCGAPRFYHTRGCCWTCTRHVVQWSGRKYGVFACGCE